MCVFISISIDIDIHIYGSQSKETACSAGDLDLTPGSGRSPGVGNGKPL